LTRRSGSDYSVRTHTPSSPLQLIALAELNPDCRERIVSAVSHSATWDCSTDLAISLLARADRDSCSDSNIALLLRETAAVCQSATPHACCDLLRGCIRRLADASFDAESRRHCATCLLACIRREDTTTTCLSLLASDAQRYTALSALAGFECSTTDGVLLSLLLECSAEIAAGDIASRPLICSQFLGCARRSCSLSPARVPLASTPANTGGAAGLRRLWLSKAIDIASTVEATSICTILVDGLLLSLDGRSTAACEFQVRKNTERRWAAPHGVLFSRV